MRKKSPELKVTLNKKVSKAVRSLAETECTTPPRLVNKILDEALTKKTK